MPARYSSRRRYSRFQSGASPRSFHVSPSTVFTNTRSDSGDFFARVNIRAASAHENHPTGLYSAEMWYPRRCDGASGFRGTQRPAANISVLRCSSISVPHASHAYAAVSGRSSSQRRFDQRSACMASHSGHGTSKYRWSDSSNAASMRDWPVIVGVDTISTLRRANVRVRARASSSGLPSPSRSAGYPSISSRNRYRTGIERRPTAEFAPVSTSTPPGKLFESTVLDPSRSRGWLTLRRRRGQSSINGSIRCREFRFAISTVGDTAIIGPGAWSMT